MGIIPTLCLFDNFDEQKCALPVCSAFAHAEQDGRWREFVVLTVKKELGGLFEVMAESVLFELRCDYVENMVLKLALAKEAVEAALGTTRWQVDPACFAFRCTVWFYHESTLNALRDIEDKWSYELYSRVEVEDGRIAARSAGVKKALGDKHGVRFAYAKNVTVCTKTVLEDDVYTALYGRGADSVVIDDDGYWTGGYTNRVRFADVNGGVPWVGSESVREMCGVRNADRVEKVHRFGEVIFKDVDDPRVLYNKTLASLVYYTAPAVLYEVDVRLFENAVPVSLGDTVGVIDTSHNLEWRFEARVLRRVRTFGQTLQTTVRLETFKQSTQDKSGGYLVARASDVVTDAETAGKIDAEIVQSAMADYLAQFDLGDEEF